MADSKKAKEEKHILGRRALIKWSLFAGATLGVPRWQVFEVLNKTGGKALADEAACIPTNRSVHIIGGQGGFAWFQLLWPHVDVAAAASDAFAFHAPGMHTMAQGTHKPLALGPQAPFSSLPGNRQITAIMAGRNQTHTSTPESTYLVAGGTTVFAAAGAIQTASPTLVPVIAVGNNTPYGAAEGSPRETRVGEAADIVALFNSAASREGGILRDPQNASLYSSSYSALLQLRAAAGTPTMRAGVAAGTSAARLLGTNLADALTITEQDLSRYGVATTTGRYREFAENLIVSAKAIKMGLTNSVVMNAFYNDPHGAFGNMTELQQNVTSIGKSMDAFMLDLAVDDPTCAGSKVRDNLVVSIHGDTPKTPLNRDGWPDNTPGNSNWIYVLGAGHLKTGWFGGINRQGRATGWNPLTGADDPNRSSEANANVANAAVLYAVAKGDLRRVGDFFRGTDYSGIVNSDIT